MKKFLMILLAFAMVFSMAGVVSADDVTGETQASEGTTEGTQMTPMVPLHPADKTDGMDLEYDLVSTYVLKIPSDVSFNTNLEHTGEVSLSNVLLPAKSMLTVTVNSLHGFHLQNGADTDFIVSKIPYSVIKDNGKEVTNYNPDNVVLVASEGVSECAETLTFKTDGKGATLSGKHTDRLTFNAHWSVNPNAETEITIGSLEQLKKFRDSVDDGNTYEGMTVKLTADIDLEAYDENGDPICFDPIGSYRYDRAFKGIFDGQGHTIRNLNQNTWALNNGYKYGDLGLGLFGLVENATIKNLNIDGSEISGESAICGVVAAVSAGETTFENIKVSNANCADYQYYAGGIVGWASGKQTFVNCHVDSSNNIAAQWGDFDNSIGGVIGGASTSAEILMKDCIVECRIDAYNDVTSTYQWYSYRRAGMLIGNSGATEKVDGTTYASAPQLTCENVIVIYGDWANYHYCEFAGTSWPYVRCEEGVSNSAYSNPRYGHPTDANGNEVVDDNHIHNDGEDHQILCVFDQLYGGGQGVYGTATHEGVTVVYNNKETP